MNRTKTIRQKEQRLTVNNPLRVLTNVMGGG